MDLPRQYVFGDFCLDAGQRALFRNGELLSLTPKSLETLLFLVERHGRIVDKKELMDAVWPDTFVEEVSLARNVSVLRKVLSESEEGQSYIETIPKRGYRFVAPVSESSDAVPASAAMPSAHSEPVKSQRFVSRLAFALAALISLFAVALWFRGSSLSLRLFPPSQTILVVLPVENLTGDPSQEYLADGLTEEVIAQLGSLSPQRLGVIARTSSMAYKHTNKTVRDIGRDLHADYVVEASLREGSGHVRFTAQLIRTRDQTHLWAHSFDRPLADVLALQNELARAIADEVRVDLQPQIAARLATARSVQPAAYDDFVRGRFHWNERSAREVHSAIDYFAQAISKDPGFAPAYASLADSYTLLTMMRDAPPGEMMPKAQGALLKALSLDDYMGDAHTVLGEISEVFNWDWATADKEFRRAIELEPNSSNARHQFAIHLAVMGRFPEALAHMKVAEQVDPVSPVTFASTGWIYLRGRRPDQAILECQKALDLDPKFARGHLCLGEAYEEKRDLEKAAEEFIAARVLTGMSADAIEQLRQALRQSGYQGYFRLRLQQLRAKATKSYVSPYDFADFSLRAGDREEALKWLEAAYAERSPYLVFLHIEPRMDSLRDDPRFQELIRHIGLSDIKIHLL
jgi:TolB-like protein/DNA-binding winged helix-turn-helix (wHTH) protein/Flp pilus assembly protein TadD